MLHLLTLVFKWGICVVKFDLKLVVNHHLKLGSI